jgi:hypothetical protein
MIGLPLIKNPKEENNKKERTFGRLKTEKREGDTEQ